MSMNGGLIMSYRIDMPHGIPLKIILMPLLIILTGLSYFAGAMEPAANPARAMTREDVEAFLDGLIPLQIQREGIAGAVVAIVKDGSVLITKGYGYSDVEHKKPVTPDATLFRPGSISKLFTWTAVMQLDEQGKIDLDKDVNSYLDFTIPAYQGKPVTLRNLMTHTPGFEESLKFLFVEDAKQMLPLKTYMALHLPTRIYPPGTIPAYSNYGASLAGYIVERVSGEPFCQYVDRHILGPLGMKRTTFAQPLPDALKPLMSNGYSRSSEKAKEFEFVQSFPAGSLSTTADDMTRFMLAHLQEGTVGNSILKPETFKRMHARAFENTRFTNGMALGFYEESRNGHRIYGHGGDTQWFHSDMHLVPDLNLGFFISYNSAGKGEVSPRSALWARFLDRYVPYQPPAGEKTSAKSDDLSQILGRYLGSRRPDTTLLALANPLGQTVVSSNPDGTISVSGFKDFSGEPKKYERIGSMLFREVNGQSLLAWKFAPDGTVEMAFDAPYQIFQKVRPLQNGMLHTIIIATSLSVFLLTLLCWPVAAMARKHYNKSLEWTRGQKRRKMLVRIICLVDLLFFMGFGALLSGDTPSILLSTKMDGWIHVVQGIGFLGAIGTIVMLYCVIRSWLEAKTWIWTKVWDGFILFAAFGYTFFVFSWHMLNFNLNF